MRTKSDYRFHSALDSQRRFFDCGGCHTLSRDWSQPCFFPFVEIRTRTDPTPISGASHLLSGQIYSEFHILYNNRIGVAFGADRDITHSRIGADCSEPSHSEHIPFFRGRAACHKSRGKGIDHRPRFPRYFCHQFFLQK